MEYGGVLVPLACQCEDLGSRGWLNASYVRTKAELHCEQTHGCTGRNLLPSWSTVSDVLDRRTERLFGLGNRPISV